jgi:hypothetical protein
LSEPGSTVRIDHGPRMVRTMTILEADPPHWLRYRQQGMGLDDTTEVRFAAADGRTRVTMTASLRVAGAESAAYLNASVSARTDASSRQSSIGSRLSPAARNRHTKSRGRSSLLSPEPGCEC